VNDVKRFFAYEAAGQIKFQFLPQIDDTKGATVFGETGERSNEIYTLLRLAGHEDRRIIDTSYHAAFRSYFESGTRSYDQDVLTSFLLGVTLYTSLRMPCMYYVGNLASS
jgi:nitrate reductase beta subunit